MRKDSVNVFSEGLNFDLNPIATPNNVLTDCVNGTFITFNGDELALQNDAGNTKVSHETVNAIRDVLWTLNESLTVNASFNWRKLKVEHDVVTNLVTYIENKHQFLYLSLPQNTELAIFNEVDYMLYDSTIGNDTLPEQLFYKVGTIEIYGGITNDLYRKKDTYNTNNPVLFKLRMIIPDIIQTGTSLEDVTLTDGFYPLGVKEEGGVLYIISGTKPEDVKNKWTEELGYAKGDFVYNDTLVKTYYQSLVDNNRNRLPLETNDFWKVIGTREDYNDYVGEVEIGSYPSPKFGGHTPFTGRTTNYNSDNVTTELYNYRTINDEYFKTMRYVDFIRSTGNNIDTEYISRYDGTFTYDPKFYKIKLYHQLNNGYLDLTPDIWDKYHDFRGSGIENVYWFTDQAFGYYCPNQYKGKLALQLEIEDISKFDLVTIPTFTFIIGVDPIPDTYTLTIIVEAEGYGNIDINNVYLNSLKIDGTTIIDSASKLTFPVALDPSTGKYIATVTYTGIDAIYKDTILEYEIVPEFTVNSLVVNDDLPQQYKDRWVITGRRVISSEYDFKFEDLVSDCNFVTQEKTSEVVVLVNTNGEYVNLNLDSSNPFVFVLQGESLPAGATLIAEYTIGPTGFPVIQVAPPPLANSEDFQIMFEGYRVKRVSTECMQTALTLTFNMDFDDCSLATILIKQGANTQLLSPAALEVYNNFEVIVQPGVYTQIEVTRSGFEKIIDNFFPTSSITRNYGFIADIKPSYEVTGNPTTPYRHFLRWDGVLGVLPTLNNLVYRYYKKNEIPSTTDLVLAKQRYEYIFTDSCYYKSNTKDVYSNTFAFEDTMNIQTSGYTNLTGSYVNIPDNSLFCTLPATMYDCGIPCEQDPGGGTAVNVIFRKTINPRLMLGESPGGSYIRINVHYSPIMVGPGNGLAGEVSIDTTVYGIPDGLPWEVSFSFGPVAAGTYSINADILIAYVNNVAVSSIKTYSIDFGVIVHGGMFNVEADGSNDILVDIYVDPNPGL